MATQPTWLDTILSKAIAASGTLAPSRGILNFTGTGVTITDNPTTGSTDVTIGVASDDIRNFGAKCDGVTDDYAAWVDASTAGNRITVPEGLTSVISGGSPTIVPRVTFLPGAKISVGSGKTVTFSGFIDAAPDKQIFAGAGLIVTSADTPEVYPDWWGTGTTTVQAAITAAAGNSEVVLLAKRYDIGTGSVGLSMPSANMKLRGIGGIGKIASATSGPELYYHGTGTAVLTGSGSGTTFTLGTQIRNVTIKTTDGCTLGLSAWAPANAIFENIAVFGPSGNTTDLIKVSQGLNTIFRNIIVNGTGLAGTAIETNYANGIHVVPVSGSPTTTTHFDGVYAHGCNLCYKFDTSFVTCSNTISETSVQGFTAINSSKADFNGLTWFENVGNAGAGFAGGFVDSSSDVRIDDMNMVVYTGTAICFQVQSGGRLTIAGRAAGTDSGTRLFDSSTTSPNALITMGPLSRSTMLITDAHAPSNETPSWKAARDMTRRIVQYSYNLSGLTTGMSAVLAAPNNGASSMSYFLPMAGNVVGMSYRLSAAVSAGHIQIQVKNGSTVILDTTSVNTQSSYVDVATGANAGALNDELKVAVTTDGSFAPITSDLIVDVFVEH